MVIGVTQSEQLHVLYEKHEWRKKLTSGLHFNFLQLSYPDNLIQVLIAHTDYGSASPIDRDTVIDQRKELNAFLLSGSDDLTPLMASSKHIERFNLLLDIVTQANMLKLNTTSPDAVLRSYFENSQAAYTQTVGAFLRRLPSPDTISCQIGSEGYSLIRHFSLLYAVEINELLDIHREKPNGYLTVIDEAAGAGFFIITCASVLPQQVLARTRFLGTDVKLADIIYGMEAARRYPIEAAWQLTDINASNHAAKLRSFNNGGPVNLLVLNHVLEHLGEYAAEEYILEWLRAAQTLIISVPFEDDYETSISSHVRQFDEASLLALGVSVERASHQQIVSDGRFAGCGLLIFRHITAQQESSFEVDKHVS